MITDALGMSSELRREPERRHRETRRNPQGPRQVKAVVESWCARPREMRETNKALEDRLKLSKQEISNPAAEPRGDPRREPDRSADRPRQPQIFRPRDREGVQSALASGEPLSLLMFDIDHFKSFNDTYGHLTGDQVLRLVAMSLKQNVKGQDITARYGGEEFAVVLPNTALRQALTVADHIRRAVMTKELKKKSTGENLGRVTISVGVAMLRRATTPSR
jgi:diguanylate cyclase